MLRSAELDVSIVLEALEALNDDIAIYGPDDRQFFINGAEALAALERERYLAMGMDGYLAKPLAEHDLLSEISRVRDAASALPMAQAS